MRKIDELAYEMKRTAEEDGRAASSSSLAAPFADRIRIRRKAGVPWVAIAAEIAAETGLLVNEQSLAKGYRALPGAGRDKASGKAGGHRKFSVAAARLLFPSLEAMRQSGMSWSRMSVELADAGLFIVSPMNVKSLWERGSS